jgi:uncharacterized membrane protein YebE (DUF533 family)
MDIERLLGSVLGGAVGSSKRRKSGITGSVVSAGLRNPAAVLGIAGVAWGLYETWKSGQQAASPTPTTSGGPSVPPVVPPPIPGTGRQQEPALPVEALRVLRLTLSAARADGNLSAAEAEQILSEARSAGAEAVVHDEMQRNVPLTEILAGVTDPEHKRQLYRLAFTVVHADEGVSDTERLYLSQLASLLALDASNVGQIETETAAQLKSVSAS